MGKNYVSVATKRLRAAANSKNLEFLRNNVPQEGKQLPSNEAQPTVNGDTRRNKTRQLKKPINPESTCPLSAIDDDELLVPMKIQPKRRAVSTRSTGKHPKKSSTLPGLSTSATPDLVCSNETQSTMWDIQKEFFEDWEEIEVFEWNNPGPSASSAGAPKPISKKKRTNADLQGRVPKESSAPGSGCSDEASLQVFEWNNPGPSSSSAGASKPIPMKKKTNANLQGRVPKKSSAPGSGCSDEAHPPVLGSPDLHIVSPVNNQALDMQMEFFDDWDEPESFDDNKEAPSAGSAGAATPISKLAKRTKPQESTAREIARTYSAKRTGNVNYPKKQTDYEIALTDDSEEDEDTQLIKTNECHCGQQPVIEKLQAENAKMKNVIKRLNKSLREANARSFKLTDVLNSKVLGDPHSEIFTEQEGFPSRDQLAAFSDQGIKSDYTFVRLVMDELWPNGFVNRSVSGRASNNPHGRPRAGGNNSQTPKPVSTVKRVPLEAEKVKYVRDRLLEHRIYRGDPPAVAKALADEAPTLMKRILAYYGKKT